jgi:hypothetical protein
MAFSSASRRAIWDSPDGQRDARPRMKALLCCKHLGKQSPANLLGHAARKLFPALKGFLCRAAESNAFIRKNAGGIRKSQILIQR